jgi:hypothetical protein
VSSIVLILRSFISPDQLYPGRIVSYDDVVAIAATLNRAEAIHFLAFLNLLLSAATTEARRRHSVAPLREVQHFLFREIVSESLLRDLHARFGEDDLLDRPILFRGQLLFAIRVVATHASEHGGNTLQRRSEFDAIGDLLLLVSGLFRTEGLQSNPATAILAMAAHLGPSYELENPPAIELTWPRVQDLLINRFASNRRRP